MIARQTSFLHDKSYLSTAAAHFFVDVLNSGRVVLVALIAVSLGMSNAQVGIFLLLYNIGGSLSQPLFGWLAACRRSPMHFSIGKNDVNLAT